MSQRTSRLLVIIGSVVALAGVVVLILLLVSEGGGEVGEDFDATMRAAEDDLDDYWEDELEAQGFGSRYESPDTVDFYGDEEEETACGPTIPNNAFYCPLDNGIYLHEPFLEGTFNDVGPFSPVYILAHEWAHMIQQNLGILEGPAFSVQVELQADCLAGQYARNLDERDHITDENLLEAAITLIAVGDPERFPWWAPGAHGTSEQRVNSYTLGYNEGFAACTAEPFPLPKVEPDADDN